jgi:hypothetical protein
LNAIVGLTGFIKVAAARVGDVEGMEERTFADSDSVVGNGLSLPVTWRGGESEINHEGHATILRFRMRHARLFGVEFV